MTVEEFLAFLEETDRLIAEREAPLVARVQALQEVHGAAWERVFRLAQEATT